MRSSLALATCLAALSGLASASFSSRNSASQYIHSNDTISLTLAPRQGNSLHGAAGSSHSLEFILTNRGTPGHFSLSQESEDNFVGQLSAYEAYLTSNQQQSIMVTNMQVPRRGDGSVVRYTLMVERDSGNNKREAPPGQQQGGGGGSYPGNNGGNYPGGGGNYNPGGGGGYNPGGNNGGNYPGGGGGNYGNGDNGNYGNGGGGYGNGNGNPGYPNYNDPSNRRELSVTVEFQVTDDIDDTSNPWTKLSYGAKSDSETCSYSTTDPNCNNDFWWVKVEMQDQKSGLHEVQAMPRGSDMYGVPIYFRHVNFPLGTVLEQEVVLAASCCLEGMTIRITDISGNQAEVEAYNDGTGTPLSKTALYGIIGGVALLVIIIIVVVVVIFCRKKNGYSQANQS